LISQKNETCVVYVSFDARKTFGKTTTIAEQLKGRSSLVSGLPSGEVLKDGRKRIVRWGLVGGLITFFLY